MPGDLYGLFESIMPLTGCSFTPCWSVTAGARSVFLGAKVTDTIGHKKLRAEYGVNIEPPKRLMDQWGIIKTISTRSNKNNPWVCKVLLFTKPWLEKNKIDLAWLRFHNYLLVKSWVQAEYMHNKVQLSLTWEAFASIIRNKNLKPGPCILANIIHNIFMANGTAPGFKPADTSELLLPSQTIEYAYENVYMLKEYAAIVMHPWKLGAMNNFDAIYYSLSYPTMVEGTPAIRHAPSIISEMRDLRMLMKTFEEILKQHSGFTYKLMKDVNFEYFHHEEDRYDEITNSKYLTKGDQNLLECLSRFKEKKFPHQGPFFRGCIRVAKKT